MPNNNIENIVEQNNEIFVPSNIEVRRIRIRKVSESNIDMLFDNNEIVKPYSNVVFIKNNSSGKLQKAMFLSVEETSSEEFYVTDIFFYGNSRYNPITKRRAHGKEYIREKLLGGFEIYSFSNVVDMFCFLTKKIKDSY